VTDAQNPTLSDRFQKPESERPVIDCRPEQQGIAAVTDRIVLGPIDSPDGSLLGDANSFKLVDARMLDASPRALAQPPPLYLPVAGRKPT